MCWAGHLRLLSSTGTGDSFGWRSAGASTASQVPAGSGDQDQEPDGTERGQGPRIGATVSSTTDHGRVRDGL